MNLVRNKNVLCLFCLVTLLLKCSESIKITAETNFVGTMQSDVPIYISSFPSYTIDEKRMREKLKVNLQRNGYYMVDDIENSRYYLIFKKDSIPQENGNISQSNLCDLTFILIKTSDRNDFFNSDQYLGKIIWRSNFRLLTEKLHTQEDRVLASVSDYFLQNK